MQIALLSVIPKRVLMLVIFMIELKVISLYASLIILFHQTD